MLPESYFSLQNGLLIIRSKFESFKNYLTAFDASTGIITWQHHGFLPATQYIGDEIFVFSYLMTPGLQGRLCIINRENGEILKDADLTDELTQQGFKASDYYRLVKQDHYLYIMAGYGKALYAFNMNTDKIDWQYKFNIPAQWLTDIKLYNDSLFITDEQENVHVLKRS